MTQDTGLKDLRAAIDDIWRSMATESRDGRVLNQEILTRLKHTRGSLIQHCAPRLVDGALTKMLNDVCRRTAANSNSDLQADLFCGYAQVPKSVTVAKGVKKSTEKMAFGELKHYLAQRDARANRKADDGIRQLVADCESFAKTDDETVGHILLRRRRDLSKLSEFGSLT